MALLTRITRLFKADIHAVLDHIEEPEQTLRQAVREMEDELAATELRIAACVQEQESLQERADEIARARTDLESELDLCFDSGKEDLAKNLVRRKLLADRAARQIDARSRLNEKFLEREQRCLAENRTTLEGLRQKADFFLARSQRDPWQARDTGLPGLAGEMSVSEAEVEIAFLRESAARVQSSCRERGES